MNVWAVLTDWFRRLRRTRAQDYSYEPLREFVYLDEVSVYSLLASRKGSIATEFTESQTTSLNSNVGGEIGIGFAGAMASLESSRQSSRIQASQVLRKSVIQTSFKELYEIERASLAMKPLESDKAPELTEISELESRFESLASEMWIIEPDAMRRGQLLEVEVELEADPIFRMASVITTIQELIEDNEFLFGREMTNRLPQMRPWRNCWKACSSGWFLSGRPSSATGRLKSEAVKYWFIAQS